MEERRYDEMNGGTILNFLRNVYNANTSDNKKEKR